MRRVIFLLPLLALNSSPRAAPPLDAKEEYLDCLIEPHQVVELGTPVPGIIDRMLVERADTIAIGQALVELESSVEQATLRHAKERAAMDGAIKAHRADLNLARQNLERMNRLFERQAVSSQKRDEARAEYEVALRNYQVAKENQRLAQLELQTQQAKLARRIIHSPINGVVVDRMTTAGEFVDERPLLTLAQLDPLRVEVLIPATLFGSIQPGMWAQVNPEISLPELPRARVVTVDRLVDSASGTFRVTLDLPNPGQHIPGGLKCSVRFLQQIADEPPAPAEDPLLPRQTDEIEPMVAVPEHHTEAELAEISLEVAPEVAPAALPVESPVIGDPIKLTESSPKPAPKAPEPIPEDPLVAQATSPTRPAEASSPAVPPLSSPLAEQPAPLLPEPAETALAPVERPETATTEAKQPQPHQMLQQAADRTMSLSKPTTWCGTLTASSSYLENLRQPLRKAGIEIHEIRSSKQAPRNFIVEMPVGKASCSRTLKKLHAAGFPDVACYTAKHSGVRMVSGGLFKVKEYALTRLHKFQAKGFDMELHPRFRKQPPQSLQLTANTRLQVLSIIAKIQPAPKLELQDAACGSENLAQR